MRSIVTVSLTCLALSACTSRPTPAPVGDPVEGQKVAYELCSSCHAAGPAGESPNPKAPPLRTVLARYSEDKLVRDLTDAVHISHLKMPQFFFGETHAADLVAYLKTIQSQP
jgi:cytochrome c2